MPAHAHGDHDTGWVFRIAILATLAFCAGELIAGLYGHSLSLLADATHNFSDALALVVTWFAYYVQSMAPSESKTYGYQRAAVLVSFAVALSLFALVGFLLWEAYRRLITPPAANTIVMLATGAVGLGVNAVISGALRGVGQKRMCPRAVFVHIAGDALAAIGIIAAALVIRLTGFRQADPALGIVICGLIVWTTWDIVAESLDILLEGLPRGMDLDHVITAIRGVRGVEDVHDVHIWSLGRHSQALSCHVRIADMPLLEGEAILCAVNAVLDQRFGISHTTIQLEDIACESTEGCVIPAPQIDPHLHHHHH